MGTLGDLKRGVAELAPAAAAIRTLAEGLAAREPRISSALLAETERLEGTHRRVDGLLDTLAETAEDAHAAAERAAAIVDGMQSIPEDWKALVKLGLRVVATGQEDAAALLRVIFKASNYLTELREKGLSIEFHEGALRLVLPK